MSTRFAALRKQFAEEAQSQARLANEKAALGDGVAAAAPAARAIACREFVTALDASGLREVEERAVPEGYDCLCGKPGMTWVPLAEANAIADDDAEKS